MNSIYHHSRTNKRKSWQSLARSGRVADAIVRYVRSHGTTTLGTLQDAFEEIIPVRGQRFLTLGDPNLVTWVGLSDPLADGLLAVINGGRLFLHPALLEAYQAQGRGLKLPVAKLPLTLPLSTAHWFPVALATESIEEIYYRFWGPAGRPER